mmetsp:Transcript_13562/g.20173  ORF Transcript_13562/g.20173 Transcript_13562/m.20173 type:complete len:186 (+) Transcript_13562:1494-2051(+)
MKKSIHPKSVTVSTLQIEPTSVVKYLIWSRILCKNLPSGSLLPLHILFLQRFLSMTNSKPIVRHAASYYLERTLQEHDFLKWRPSLVCASAVILAMNQAEIAVEADICHLLPISDEAYFPPILLEYTGFRKRDISECAKLIATKVALEPVTASNRQLVAVKKKYDSRKYSNVSRDYDLPEMPEYY